MFEQNSVKNFGIKKIKFENGIKNTIVPKNIIHFFKSLFFENLLANEECLIEDDNKYMKISCSSNDYDFNNIYLLINDWAIMIEPKDMFIEN